MPPASKGAERKQLQAAAASKPGKDAERKLRLAELPPDVLLELSAYLLPRAVASLLLCASAALRGEVGLAPALRNALRERARRTDGFAAAEAASVDRGPLEVLHRLERLRAVGPSKLRAAVPTAVAASLLGATSDLTAVGSAHGKLLLGKADGTVEVWGAAPPTTTAAWDEVWRPAAAQSAAAAWVCERALPGNGSLVTAMALAPGTGQLVIGSCFPSLREPSARKVSHSNN